MTSVLRQDGGENWIMFNGDCVELSKGLDDNSIDYSISSPPFADLYCYSDSERDMGNCRNYDEFFIQYGFLINELYRVIKPGRNVSIHCMNIPAMKERDGFIGIKDFRGDIIRAFQKAGFIYHAEAVIWKDPLIEAVRTKALGLMHKQLCKDSLMCRQGLPDYIVTMRKPGTNKDPVDHPKGLTDFAGDGEIDEGTFSHNVWRKYASPVWMDIRQTHTLNRTSAREEADEKHVCPLQLDSIERCVELWSKEGDVILSPFAGIGSEGYQAVKMGRKFIGFELKESYYNQAVKNLTAIETAPKQMEMFT